MNCTLFLLGTYVAALLHARTMWTPWKFLGLAWVWPHHPSCWPLVLRQAPSPLRNLVSSVGSVLVVQLQAFGVLHKGELSFHSKTFGGHLSGTTSK